MLVTGGCRPKPVVRLRGEAAVLEEGEDKDYVLSYERNDQPGQAVVMISGRGDYAGKRGFAAFKVFGRYYAKPTVETEGDGMSWATAMSVTNLFATLGTTVGPCEAWLGTGTVSAAAISITNRADCTIIGGFAGTETTPEDREPGALTVFDGERKVDVTFRVENDEGYELTIDGLKFCRAKSNGFIKAGAGNLKAFNCVIEANGKETGKSYGRGMNVTASGVGTLVVSNCTFAGNRNDTADYNYGGFGIYVDSFKSALVENSLFVTNGCDIAGPGDGVSQWRGYFARGSAIGVSATPITVRSCRFAGNCCPIRLSSGDAKWGGGTVTLMGASGGSLIDHCVFIGNTERLSYQGGTGIDCGGTLVVNLANKTDKVDVRSCTFAYNATHGQASAAGITVLKGDVEVENSIFWKNVRNDLATAGYGTDVQVQGNGSLAIRHSTVTTLDGTGLAKSGNGVLTIDPDTVLAGDPKLVTPTEFATSLMTITASSCYYKPGAATYAGLAAMDAHLLSAAGYVVNGGATGEVTNVTSPAIDLGDPLADYSLEPAPNGERLNLGAFGNTPEASMTVDGQPKADVEVTFPDGMTRPLVTISMGLESGVGYNATVLLTCSTGGVPVAEVPYYMVPSGTVLEYKLPFYMPVGDEIDVAVSITAAGATDVGYEKSGTATGGYPAHYGKGGGANVIHVRTGADCRMDGSNWTDAYPDLPSAIAALADETKTEIWLSVTNDYFGRTVTIPRSMFIRGGFAGVENDAASRPEGLFSTLFGNGAFSTMTVSVPQGATLSVERIRFSKASGSELKKDGKGDLVVLDCDFTDSTTGSVDGKGVYATGGTVAITNCNFVNLVGPREIGDSNGGDAIRFKECTRAFVDRCLFVTNGPTFSPYHPGWSRHKAGAVLVGSTPAVFSNCRFAAVCAAQRYATDGGVLCFVGKCGGSKVVNCTFTGNSDFESANAGTVGASGGAIACEMDSKDLTLDVVNCTVAYNLSQGAQSAAGINVYKGTVNLSKSIVFGNVRGRQTGFYAGADIDVKANGVLNIEDTLVTDLTSNSVHAVEGGTINWGKQVLTGDPLLVTTTNDFRKLLTSGSSYWSLPASAQAACAAFDVHLRGGLGYLDERTGLQETTYRKTRTQPNSPVIFHAGHNWGAYGDTPYATMPKGGMILMVR